MVKKTLKTHLFYKPPSNEIFNEVRGLFIKFWCANFDNTFGYVDGKVERLRSMTNSGSEFMGMFQMLHHNTLKEFVNTNIMSNEAKKEFILRLIDGGYDLVSLGISIPINILIDYQTDFEHLS